MTVKTVFQDFYRVPDYQREYVWGQSDGKSHQGDQVEQFLADIYNEYQAATSSTAPEYFIGTIVVCPTPEGNGLLDLIDGQQRITTLFISLCALRDFYTRSDLTPPQELENQIAATTIDWRGISSHRPRLELQYEDSRGILGFYVGRRYSEAPRFGSRSIANLANAYDTVRSFISSELKDSPTEVQRFYGYLTNKVKLIRIQTTSVAKALNIFETINDRGLGLDAMDLLKNLLFMSANPSEFDSLKVIWKQMTTLLYEADEKPLRFLRYVIFADYDIEEAKLQEDDIYDWLRKNGAQTGHPSAPLAFAKRLRDAAAVYSNFTNGKNPQGTFDEGVTNTRLLGGRAIRQHFLLLLSARHLDATNFSRISTELESLMFAYLITETSTRYYERELIDGAKRLRRTTNTSLAGFVADFFIPAKARLKKEFAARLSRMHFWDTRTFRVRYLLAKLTQNVDFRAYGPNGPHGSLSNYVNGDNDIEHILAVNATPEALREFGPVEDIHDDTQRLGNLLLIERPINQLLGPRAYSSKAPVYSQSQFLLAKCQAHKPTFGKADQITKVVSELVSYPFWNHEVLLSRQDDLVRL